MLGQADTLVGHSSLLRELEPIQALVRIRQKLLPNSSLEIRGASHPPAAMKTKPRSTFGDKSNEASDAPSTMCTANAEIHILLDDQAIVRALCPVGRVMTKPPCDSQYEGVNFLTLCTNR